MLVAQIVTGIVLAMHYQPSAEGAFDSVDRIRRDVNFGDLIRNLHAVGASMFFLAAYVHIFRGLYYGSYKAPREVLWIIGVFIFVVMMATAFMGYSLPWGQMSFWGVTVITNLFSSLDSIWKGLGTTIVEWLWGGYSVIGHDAQPLLQPALSAAVRDRRPRRPAPVGAARRRPEQPDGPRHQDRVGRRAVHAATRPPRTRSACSPSCCCSRISCSSCRTIWVTPTTTFRPNPLVTPPHIVPEWYFLPFYAILRAIPSKLFGVIAMFSAIIVLLFVPWLDTSRVRSTKYRPVYRWFFWLFVFSAVALGWLGSKPPDAEYVFWARVFTIYYFAHFLVVMPLVGWLETPLKVPGSITEAVLGHEQSAKLAPSQGLRGLA